MANAVKAPGRVKRIMRRAGKNSAPIGKYFGVLKEKGPRSDELAEAIRGIQRGLDGMVAGKGEPARKVLDRIRAKYKIPRSSRRNIIGSL